MITVYRKGNTVKIQGIVLQGKKKYKVDTAGVIKEVYTKTALITLEEVHGNSFVDCIVKRSDIVGVIH